MSRPFCPGIYTKGRREWAGAKLPPSRIAQPLGIHLAHVSHSNDANCGSIFGELHVEGRRSCFKINGLLKMSLSVRKEGHYQDSIRKGTISRMTDG